MLDEVMTLSLIKNKDSTSFHKRLDSTSYYAFDFPLEPVHSKVLPAESALHSDMQIITLKKKAIIIITIKN